MTKAVIWDFGGVITSSPFEAFNRYEAERDIPLDFIRRLNATNPDTNAWARFERSEVSIEEFDGIFLAEAKAAGFEIPGRDVIACLSGDVRPVSQTEARLKEAAKLGFTRALLPKGSKTGSRKGGGPLQLVEIGRLHDLVEFLDAGRARD